MNTLGLILIAVAVSIDGFWGGFSFGLRKIYIPFASLLIISGWSVICTMITMLLGSALNDFIPLQTAKLIGAGLLFLLGIIALKEGLKQKKAKSSTTKECLEKPEFKIKNLFRILENPLLADIDQQNDIKPSEGTLLGLAVAMDASVAAFTVALMGCNPFITPFLFGLAHFVMIGLGNILSRYKLVNNYGQRFAFLPGLILIILAAARII